MKIFISENDRQNAKSVALKNLARFFNIREWEYKQNAELYEELSYLSTNYATTIMELLNAYFIAYDHWFKFYDEKRQI